MKYIVAIPALILGALAIKNNSVVFAIMFSGYIICLELISIEMALKATRYWTKF